MKRGSFLSLPPFPFRFLVDDWFLHIQLGSFPQLFFSFSPRQSPLFKVSNSDTIWVGKTYNNWTMYFCSLCPYQSRIKSHLWRHSVKHTGQKPFVCALCLKAFSRRDNLKQHMNYKHPGYDLEPKRDTPAARQAAATKTIIKGV
jgi:hypothetical protein